MTATTTTTTTTNKLLRPHPLISSRSKTTYLNYFEIKIICWNTHYRFKMFSIFFPYFFRKRQFSGCWRNQIRSSLASFGKIKRRSASYCHRQFQTHVLVLEIWRYGNTRQIKGSKWHYNWQDCTKNTSLQFNEYKARNILEKFVAH